MSLDAILACLCGGTRPTSSQSRRDSYSSPLLNEKPPFAFRPYRDTPPRAPNADNKQAADDIVAILRTTHKSGAALKADLDNVTSPPVSHTTGWSEWLAENIFEALRSTLRPKYLDGQDTTWAAPFMSAYETAKSTVEEHFKDFIQYAKEHPGEIAMEVLAEIILSLIAFGILVLMARWVLTLLGFSELGPVAGMSP